MVISNPTISRSDQTVQHIKELQEAEMQTFQELENQTGTTTLTSAQKSELIDRINNLTATRENLYATLQENQSYYDKNLTSAQHTLVQQTDALEVVERELNRTKNRVQLLNDERVRRLRLVEINRYYGDKYKHHTSILKDITLMFALLLVLVIVNNTGVLPNVAFKGLMILILTVGLYVIGMELYDAYTRDNMVYDQYNWSKINPDWEHPTTTQASIFSNLEDDLGICENQECCDTGFTWVPPPFNKCIANSELDSEKVKSKMGGKVVKPYNPQDGVTLASVI